MRASRLRAAAVGLAAMLLASCARDKSQVAGTAGSGAEAEPPAKLVVTFVELGSVDCIPCKKMQVVMREVETEYANQVRVLFYDVWTEAGKPYAKEYGIRVIPTQVFLDAQGKEYARHEGYFPKAELVEVLKRGGVR